MTRVIGDVFVGNARQALKLDEVYEQVQADSLGKWDTRVPRSELWMQDGRVMTVGGQVRPLAPTPWATGQITHRLGIPTSYFRKCPPWLQDQQFNFWTNQPSARAVSANGENGNGSKDSHAEKWLLRAKNETLRGVLSSSYSPLDHTTLLECVRPLLDGRYQADWFGLSDETLHLRVVDPRLTRDVLPGDGLSAGMHLSNSEVGLRAVTVDACVFRQICSNGLVRLVKGRSLLKQRHLHISQPRFEVALEEAVSQAIQEASGFVEQLGRTARQPVRDVEKTLEKLGIHWGLSQSVLDAARRSMLSEVSGQQETLYGLVNGLTYAAQSLSDEERYDLETLAGRLAESGLHGLDGDKPKRRREQNGHAVPLVDEPDEEIAWSLAEQAAELFEAQVVAVVPHDEELNGLEEMHREEVDW